MVHVADKRDAVDAGLAQCRPGDVLVLFGRTRTLAEMTEQALAVTRVKILMTNHSLGERAGSESYLETVSAELRAARARGGLLLHPSRGDGGAVPGGRRSRSRGRSPISSPRTST